MDASPHPEMLCWLREDEMSVQELLQRLQCVITHVGESRYFLLVWLKKRKKEMGIREEE